MSSLFKSSQQDAGTKTVDIWATMPDFLKDRIEQESGMKIDMLEQAFAEAEALGQDPREILGFNPDEVWAKSLAAEGIGEADALGDAASEGMGRGLEGYENLYTDDVVDTTLEGMQRQADRDRLAREGRAAAVGGTSNTRAAVGQAVADQLTGMNMAEMEAKLRSGAFDTAADLDLRERDLMDQFATSGLTRSLAGADWMKGYGAEERGLDQLQMDEERTGNQQALTWLNQMFGGAGGASTPIGGGETTGTTPGPSLGGQILGGIGSVAGMIGMLSDETAKEEIVKDIPGLDALKDVTPAAYKYRDDAPTDHEGRTAGLMAQELQHIEGAVKQGDDGYLRVDPYPVLATVVKAVKELDDRTNPHQAGLH